MVFQVRMVKRYGKENRIKKAENTRSRPIFSTAISSDNLLCSRGRLNVPRKMYIGIAEILLTVHTLGGGGGVVNRPIYFPRPRCPSIVLLASRKTTFPRSLLKRITSYVPPSSVSMVRLGRENTVSCFLEEALRELKVENDTATAIKREIAKFLWNN